MFKPAKMSRIRIIVGKYYFENVISALQDIGVMQFEMLPEKAAALLTFDENVDYKKVGDYAQRFRALDQLLYPVPSSKKLSFDSMDELFDAADSIDIDGRLMEMRKELDEIEASLQEAHSRILLLDRIIEFKGDLSILNSENIKSFIVYGQQLEPFTVELKKAIKKPIIIPLQNSTIFSVRRSDEKLFSTAAERYRITIEYIPDMNGKAQGQKFALEKKISTLNSRKSSLDEELKMLSNRYYPTISAIREQFDLEVEKLEVASKLGVSGSVVVMEGWVPESDTKKLEALIKNITKDRYILEYIKTSEHPPTKLQNPITFKLFELFVKFYSIPKSAEIDPTIMFAIAFPIFYGFMVGDAGYGLLMLGIAFWIIRKVKSAQKKGITTGALGGFVHNIVGDNGLTILAKSIIPGAIIAIFVGIFFNEWFGFHLAYNTPFNVEQHLPTLLVTAGWIGVFMVSFGFILGFLNKLAEGDKKHAIAKLGWLAAAWGFVIFGLNIIHMSELGAANPVAIISYVLLIVGILTIAVTEGVQGLLELPSLISHILSYTRLVGILLASVIHAEVIDLIFTSGWNHSLLLGLIGTVILILGQLFNITLAMFEPGIQGARLIYVEFFSKFFEGNGRAFKPFSNDRKHTLTRFKIE